MHTTSLDFVKTTFNFIDNGTEKEKLPSPGCSVEQSQDPCSKSDLEMMLGIVCERLAEHSNLKLDLQT